MPDDARAHDLLLCIGSGKTVNDENRLKYKTPNFYVRSSDEMWQIFGAELPEALNRTVEIADMCDLELPKGINYLPNYPIPPGEALSPDDYFEKVVRDGYQTRKARVWTENSRMERLPARWKITISACGTRCRSLSAWAMPATS